MSNYNFSKLETLVDVEDSIATLLFSLATTFLSMSSKASSSKFGLLCFMKHVRSASNPSNLLAHLFNSFACSFLRTDISSFLFKCDGSSKGMHSIYPNFLFQAII
ncbi:hypothetical protein AAZV13_15G204900 [Glycine max]